MYADGERVVGVRIHDLDSARPGGREYYQLPEFLDYQTQAQSFEDVIAGTGENIVYTSDAGSEQFNGGLASGNTFSVMGVGAAIGRTLWWCRPRSPARRDGRWSSRPRVHRLRC